MIAEVQNLKNPCALCMGFCFPDTEKCILCNFCMNWFHQDCAKLSNKRFNELTNNSTFKCSICIDSKKCDTCESEQIDPSNSLYCVTCLKVQCDDCSSFSSYQTHLLRSTDKPYYCITCSLDYPCLICKEHCYNDIIHQPSIMCDFCNNWVHQKCSKLTINQFNKYGQIDLPYYCTPCLANTMPFTKLSRAGFDRLFDENSLESTSLDGMGVSSCSLCVECNTDCDDCSVCPNMHRICSNCITCKYLTTSDFNTMLTKKGDEDISFIHFNIRSLTKHAPSVSDLIYNSFDKNPDIICISETKLGLHSDLNSVQLRDYKFLHNDSKTNAGGTGIYISEDLDIKPRPDLDFNKHGECEASFVEIQVANPRKKNMILGSIYRHPHDNHDDFFQVFCDTIDKINKNFSIVLLGDLNINTSSNDNNSKDYKDVLLSHGLTNTINLPTRITESSETVIDHLITNIDLNILDSGVLTEEVSDHLPIFGIAKICAKRSLSTYTYAKRRFNPTKKHMFVSSLLKGLERDPIIIDSDPETSLHNLTSVIQAATDEVFPIIKLSNKQRKRFRNPWITPGIIKSIDDRDKLLQKWIKTKCQADKSLYNRKRNQVTRIIEAAKKLHKCNEVDKAGNDVKKIWRCVNKMINKKSNHKSNLPGELIIDDSHTINDPKTIANHLNRHFVSKGPNLAAKLPELNKSILGSMGTRNPASINFADITVSEVVNIVGSFDNNKAFLIKWAIDHIAPILASIFNQCVNSGLYPKSLKIARVTPLFKSGNKSVADNYRPISVLPQINKIFEKIIHERMVSFEKQHKLLNNCQFGFRKGHSTSHGITHVNEQIIKHLEKKKVCALLFVDLKSAFDTVNINILLKKLEHYGYRGKMLSLLTSYLQDRKQYVHCGEIDSCVLSVICGVPQGSVLGPLLFILYINDIVNCSDFEDCLFADDAGLLIAADSVKELKKKIKEEVKLLHEWLIINKLTLNLSKTKYMLLGSNRKLSRKVRKKFRITIGNYTIHEVDQIKYLGVIVDRNLSWAEHADYLITKLSRVAGVMYRIRNYLPMKARLLVYNSLAGSCIQYGIAAWGSCSSTVLNKIQDIQDKILRYMTYSQPHSNVDSKYTNLKILKVKDLYKYETSKFMHCVYHNNMPVIFSDYFQAISHAHPTSTRENTCFYIPFFRTERGKNRLGLGVFIPGQRFQNLFVILITSSSKLG